MNFHNMQSHLHHIISKKTLAPCMSMLKYFINICLNNYSFFSSGNNWLINMTTWLCQWKLWELSWGINEAWCKNTQRRGHVFAIGIEEATGQNQSSTKTAKMEDAIEHLKKLSIKISSTHLHGCKTNGMHMFLHQTLLICL